MAKRCAEFNRCTCGCRKCGKIHMWTKHHCRRHRKGCHVHCRQPRGFKHHERQR